MQTLKLPKSGQAMEEATIVEWTVDEGESVVENDAVVLFETDKMTSEVVADRDGVLLERSVEVGETVPIGTVLGYVGDPDDTLPDSCDGTTAASDDDSGSSESGREDGDGGTLDPGQEDDDGGPAVVRGSPSARRVAREADVDVEAVGQALDVSQVRQSDVEDYLATQSVETDGHQVRGSPYAMKRAEELGVDLEAVGNAQGTDRVRSTDVETFAGSRSEAATDATPGLEGPEPGMPEAGTTDNAVEADAFETSEATGTGESTSVGSPPVVDEVLPLDGARSVMYDRMSTVASEYGSTTTVARVDVTDLVDLRDDLAPAWEEEYDVRPSYTAFVVAAAARSLSEYRILNAEVDDDEGVRLYGDVNVGIAVNADDGLLVPTVYDADKRSVREISGEIARLAGAAREGSLEYDELQNGTFTVSNAGNLGAYINTPQINPPQSAILGMCTIFDEPGIVDGEVVPRKMMHLCLTYDHRVVEGATAVGFLQSVKDHLETPASLLS